MNEKIINADSLFAERSSSVLKLVTLGENLLMSRNEAALYLGVSPKTLAVWASTKRYTLPFVKIGHLAKYRKSDLDQFITANSVK
jgi:excisionase family DNA binding protein